jgi:cytochrome c-type biogenesis protein CcmH
VLKLFQILGLALLFSHAAMAAVDVYEFNSDDERRRYQHFLEELRCPKCKNQNLAGTNSQIAVDLRRELHKMVHDGKTDAEIIDFMVSRYGDFVLYRPPLKASTLALWMGPVVFLLTGLTTVGVIVWRRRRFVPEIAKLSEEEQKQLAAMLDQSQQSAKKS